MARSKRKRGQVPGAASARRRDAREAPQRRAASPVLLMGGLLAVVILLGGVLVAMFRSSPVSTAWTATTSAPLADIPLPTTLPTQETTPEVAAQAGSLLTAPPPTAGQEVPAVTDTSDTTSVWEAAQTEIEPQQVQRISVADAKVLVDKGEAVLYDTRRPETFSEGHAAGAVSFPESELEVLLPTLPTDKALVFYCT